MRRSASAGGPSAGPLAAGTATVILVSRWAGPQPGRYTRSQAGIDGDGGTKLRPRLTVPAQHVQQEATVEMGPCVARFHLKHALVEVQCLERGRNGPELGQVEQRGSEASVGGERCSIA